MSDKYKEVKTHLCFVSFIIYPYSTITLRVRFLFTVWHYSSRMLKYSPFRPTINHCPHCISHLSSAHSSSGFLPSWVSPTFAVSTHADTTPGAASVPGSFPGHVPSRHPHATRVERRKCPLPTRWRTVPLSIPSQCSRPARGTSSSRRHSAHNNLYRQGFSCASRNEHINIISTSIPCRLPRCHGVSTFSSVIAVSCVCCLRPGFWYVFGIMLAFLSYCASFPPFVSEVNVYVYCCALTSPIGLLAGLLSAIHVATIFRSKQFVPAQTICNLRCCQVWSETYFTPVGHLLVYKMKHTYFITPSEISAGYTACTVHIRRLYPVISSTDFCFLRSTISHPRLRNFRLCHLPVKISFPPFHRTCAGLFRYPTVQRHRAPFCPPLVHLFHPNMLRLPLLLCPAGTAFLCRRAQRNPHPIVFQLHPDILPSSRLVFFLRSPLTWVPPLPRHFSQQSGSIFSRFWGMLPVNNATWMCDVPLQWF